MISDKILKKEFAFYKGEELLCIGTIPEIAEHEGVLDSTIQFYMFPCYKKRLEKRKKVTSPRILIELVDDEVEYYE